MVALHSGVGQVVDANLLETMFQMMGPLVSLYGVTGEQQPRLGPGSPTRCRVAPTGARTAVGGGVDQQRLGGRHG